MEWFTHVLVLALAFLLLAHSAYCLKPDQTAPYVRWFGALTLFLLALGSALYWLLASGTMVLSPEFALVLVRGPVGVTATYVLVASIVIGTTVAWHTARLASDMRPRLALLLGAGILLALLSTAPLYLLDAINPEDAPSQHIYLYPLWWPPLLIWIAVCTVEIVLTALRVEPRHVRIWMVSAFITVLAYYALRVPLPFYLDSMDLSQWITQWKVFSVGPWKLLLALLIPVNMGLGTWLTLRLREMQPNKGRWTRRVMTLIAACLGLMGVSLWYMLSDYVPLALPWIVWIGWFAVLAIVAVFRLGRAWRVRLGSVSVLPRPARNFSILLLILLAFALGLPLAADLLSRNPIAVFTLVTLGWIVLTEAILPGPIRPVAHWTLVASVRNAQSSLRQAYGRLGDRLAGVRTKIVNMVKKIFSADSWPKALIKVLLGIVVVIALSDIPHAGKTIIQPFKVSVKVSDSDKEVAAERLGEITANHLQLALAALHRDLQPQDIDLLRTQESGTAQAPGKEKSIAFVPPADSGAAAFAASQPLEIGPLKVPVSSIAGLIQTPIRNLLGVRVIAGTLYKAGESRYSLLADSSDGASWKVSQDAKTGSESIERLSELLALQIMQADAPALKVPRSVMAFDAFRQGLTAWRNFSNQEDWDELTKAIRSFRYATEQDPEFALARYYLGVALLNDHQPGAAAEAFRSAIKVDPGLVAGKLALATTLVYFDAYYSAPAAVSVKASSHHTKKSRFQEARQLLLQVVDAEASVSGHNLASSYYGLCRAASFDNKQPLAYFYCQRAASLYSNLRATRKADQQDRANEAVVLNEIGVILEQNNRKDSYSTTDWHCSVGNIDIERLRTDNVVRKIEKSPYTSAALRYYQRAISLLPSDPVIRCNIASAAYANGDTQPMKALESDALVHLWMADQYRESARSYVGSENDPEGRISNAYYHHALFGYAKATSGEQNLTAVNPHHFDAMNGYAYVFWQWRLNAPDASVLEISPSEAEWGEFYARAALQLAANKPKHIQAMARSTLGEVLLALARPHEAIEELELAAGEAPEHPLFHEIRWDLAQAYICAAENAKSADLADQRHSWIKKSIVLLNQIHQEERVREYRPYTDIPRLLNPAYYQAVCAHDVHGNPQHPIESADTGGARKYILRGGKPTYASLKDRCEWSGVQGDVHVADNAEAGPKKVFWMRVWGGGLNQRVRLEPVAKGQPETQVKDVIGLGHGPKNTRQYYFAQLEEVTFKKPAAGESAEESLIQPVSPVYAIETKQGCDKNKVTLHFEQRL